MFKECEFCSVHSNDLINLSSFPPFNRDRYVKSFCQLLKLPSNPTYEKKIGESPLCQDCFQTLEEISGVMKKFEAIQIKITDLRGKVEDIFLQGHKRQDERNKDSNYGDSKTYSNSIRQIIINDIGLGSFNENENNILYPDITIKEEQIDINDDVIPIITKVNNAGQNFNYAHKNNSMPNNIPSFSHQPKYSFPIPPKAKGKFYTDKKPIKPIIKQGNIQVPLRGPKVLTPEEVVILKREALTKIPRLSLIKVEEMSPEELQKSKSLISKRRPRSQFSNINKNSNGGPVDCKKCGKTMAHRYSLTRHIYVVHTLNRKPFSCSQCTKKFKLLSELKEHALVHSGVCLYICEKCGKKMSSKTTLEKHVLNFHVKKASFVCPICSRKFKHLSQINKHSQSHLARDVNCHLCGKKLSNKYNLQKHIEKIHNKKNKYEELNEVEIILP